MKKKVYLKLDELKVKSFITTLDERGADLIKAGNETYEPCPVSEDCTQIFACTQKIVWTACHPECVM